MPKLKLLFASTVLQSVISLSETKLMSFENYLSLSLFTFLFCVVFLVAVVVVVESGYSCGSGAYLEMKVTHSLAANNFAGRIQVACYEFLRLTTLFTIDLGLSLSISLYQHLRFSQSNWVKSGRRNSDETTLEFNSTWLCLACSVQPTYMSIRILHVCANMQIL